MIDHDLWSDRALVRKVEAEVDRGFPHFGLQITCLGYDVLDCSHQLRLDLIWLKVPEVSWKGFLDELEQAEIVLEVWVL